METAKKYVQTTALKCNLRVKKEKINETKTQKNNWDFINKFEIFLLNLNYAETTVKRQKTGVLKLCKIFHETSDFTIESLSDCKAISKEMIIEYEQYLFQQIKSSKLKPTSAYCDLKTLRLFLMFLYFNKIITYRYEIPKDMIVPVQRSNLYIDSTTIIKLAENIAKREHTVYRYRNLALLLLFIETGCRPVEASNILLSDIKFTERTIRLTSVKSGTRILKLNEFVFGIFKQYYNVIKLLNPNNEYFFY